MSGDSWNGEYSLLCMGNLAWAQSDEQELSDFLASDAYLAVPGTVRSAVCLARAQARQRVALFQTCIASFCEPWFDNSAFDAIPARRAA